MTSTDSTSASLFELLHRLNKVNVLVLGDVMLDRFVYGSVDRISPEAPIPVLTVEREEDMLGGAGNVARNVASLRGQCTIVSVVGIDEAATSLKRLFANCHGIDAKLVADATRPTTVKIRHVADGQQILRSDLESRAPISGEMAIQLLKEFRNALHGADVVILSDYAKGVLSADLTGDAIAAARSAGKSVIVDPKGKDFGKYAGATVITPNRLELQVSTGIDCGNDTEVTEAGRKLVDGKICESVVVTRGKEGMSVVTPDGGVHHLHTTARGVFDVAGAGDTVISTLALALAAGGNLVESAILANLAAGIVVGKYGTASVTTRELLEKFDSQIQESPDAADFELPSVLSVIRGWRNLGLQVAFTNGCFDLLHAGHLALLQAAKKSADRLVVGLNSDSSVKRLKGNDRPVQSERARAEILQALKFVDAVVIFEEDTPSTVVEAISPDVLVKGTEYNLENVVGAEMAIRRGGRVELGALVPDPSTTGTVSRLRKYNS